MRIAIMGAGLGGLCLARALEGSGHEVLVYERDATRDERHQGVYIGLRPGGAQWALRELGLLEQVQAAASMSTSLAFTQADGETLFELKLPAEYALMSVSRSELRRLLLEACPQPVHFGRAFVRYEETPSSVLVHFEDGTQVEADLLVGCDGLSSRVRAQRVDDSLVSLGLAAARGTVDAGVLGDQPLLRHGGFLCAGGGATLFVQRFGEDERVLWAYTEPSRRELAPCRTPAQVLDYVRRAVRGWHAPIHAVLETTQADDVSGVYLLRDRELMKAAVGGRVALVGDACHPMSPFKGEGGNMATANAVALGRLLTDPAHRAAPVPELVARFEQAALRRAEQPWRSSRRAARDFHGPGAPARIRQWQKGPLS